MVSQTQFVVANEIGECPGCGRTCVLRVAKDPLEHVDDGLMVVCSRCMNDYYMAIELSKQRGADEY